MATAAPAPVHVTPLEPVPWVYVPPPTQPLAVIADSPELRRLNVRQVRQLAAAVALCERAPIPRADAPTAYVPHMKELAVLRAAGSSWRAALAECGLEVPDDDEVTHQARASRDALPSAWDGIAGVLGQLEVRLPSWVFDDLKKTFLRLL